MRALFLILAALTASAVAAAEGALTLGAGAEYTSGKYGGTEKTDTWYLPFSAKYEVERVTLKLTVPYVRITGPGNVIGAAGDRVTVAGSGQRRTESGLGDIVASGFYTVMSERDSFIGLDLGVKIKFGTADEKKGLGTGENDYSLQADLFKPLGAFTAFGSLGYRKYGDPQGLDLRDVFYETIGGSYRASADTSFGAMYDHRPAITATGGSVSEVTAFLSQRLTREVKLQPYAIRGFGKASPDWGAGVQLTYRY